MPITVEQVDSWRSAPTEDRTLEFKEAKNNFDSEKLFGYCVAIGNEGGGHLILGVKNKLPRAVVGTTVFQNPSQVEFRILQKLGFRVEVGEVEHPAGRVVVFSIPCRFKGTAFNLEGRYLMRSGESLVAMTPEQLRQIFAEGAPDWLEESSRAGLSAEEVIELLDVGSFFKLLSLPEPNTQAGILDRLRSERLIDQVGDKYSIRRLGGLLLAKEIKKFPDLAFKAARVVVYTEKGKLRTKIDRTAKMGYAVGFRPLVKFVMDQLPQNEVVEDALRKEVKLVPDEVIRELVANALIHQDFLVTGAAVAVDIYSNRIEVSNPGLPIIKPERFIDEYQSRNPRLADLMRRMGICEEKGSGIDKVILNAEYYQLPAPNFRAGGMRTQITLYGHKKIEVMDRDDRIRACYQHCALKFVMSERMTNQTLRKRFNLPEAKSAIISQIIGATIDAGFIKPDEKVGASKRFARYVPFWA